jgi:predicted enzyme related to lactoylglutathione lyase
MSMNNTICWTDIPVNDLDRAIRFYTALLGKDVTKQSGPRFEFGLLPHADNNVSGCLARMEGNRPCENGPLVYLSVEGRLDDAIGAARANGGRVVQERHPIGPHGHRAVIIDSEGNRVALHSHSA